MGRSRDAGINDTNRALLKVEAAIASRGKKDFSLRLYRKLEPLLVEALERCRKAIAYYGDPEKKAERAFNRLLRS